MESDRHFRSLLALLAVGLFALAACNTDSQPETFTNNPLVATGKYTVINNLLSPDSTTWTFRDSAGTDSGAERPTCKGFACADTFHLPHSLRADSVSLELWTLGIRTTTLFFSERGSSPTLDLKKSTLRDTLDTLLLARYAFISADQKAVFAPLGVGAASLVGYYASLILEGDPSFVGKPWPVGMDTNSVRLALVYLACKSNLPVSQLLRLSLDSSAVQSDISTLIRAKLLLPADSATMFPPYPVRLVAPIGLNDSLTIGGRAVSVTGAFAWTAGTRAVPQIEIRSSTGLDTNISYKLSALPQGTATEWNLLNGVALRAKSTASAGTDTLIVTLATDSASVTSRTLVSIVPGPQPPILTPNGGAFNSIQTVVVGAPSVVDSIQISSDSLTWVRYSSAVKIDSSVTLYARARRNGAVSPVTAAVFSIHIPPTPNISPYGGIFHDPQTATISAAGSDSIQTSTDSTNWSRYSTAIPVAASQRIYARSFLGGISSAVSSATFAIDFPPVPTIAPGNGTFYGTQTILVVAAGSDSIQVSMDSSNWTRYTTTIVASESGKLYARSFLGGIPSVVATSVFSIRFPPLPAILPAGGTFTSPESASVSAPGADSIQTSTDSANWTRYANGVIVSSSGKLYARAFLGGASSVVWANFHIEIVTLSDLVVSGHSLSPVFGSGTLAYGTDTVASSTSSVVVSPTTTASSATVSCNEISCANPLPLTGLRTQDTIVVTNGTSTFTYYLTVYRRPASPSIAPSGGAFDTVRTAIVTAPGADSIQVSTDSAKWTTYTGGVNVAWSQKVYARAFVAGFVSAPTVAVFKINLAYDTTLASLRVNATTIPLVASKTNYTTDSVSVDFLSLTVYAVPTSPTATVTYNGSTSGLIDLIGPRTPVTIVVTNGGSTLTYSLAILQAQ
jgi:hypothetical protein